MKKMESGEGREGVEREIESEGLGGGRYMSGKKSQAALMKSLSWRWRDCLWAADSRSSSLV